MKSLPHKIFVIDIQYNATLEKIDAAMINHIKFLKKQYDQHIFLASGRKNPRTGGIILSIAKTQTDVEKIMATDPFIKLGLATFTVTEFQTSQAHPAMKVLLDGLLGAQL